MRNIKTLIMDVAKGALMIVLVIVVSIGMLLLSWELMLFIMHGMDPDYRKIEACLETGMLDGNREICCNYVKCPATE